MVNEVFVSIIQFKNVFSWLMLSRKFLSCFHHVNSVANSMIASASSYTLALPLVPN